MRFKSVKMPPSSKGFSLDSPALFSTISVDMVLKLCLFVDSRKVSNKMPSHNRVVESEEQHQKPFCLSIFLNRNEITR